MSNKISNKMSKNLMNKRPRNFSAVLLIAAMILTSSIAVYGSTIVYAQSYGGPGGPGGLGGSD